ncbi:polysaccharide deacetylase family protein [Paraglaciecola aquimarina]|uniref:Polysaccharide deacetylase family protein n=1 Tax=Paraglaciecola aquimarina TaxID=1235557 RepID=A0ABU3T275_9ALTE|nr:polysaccharide deacetylase family protein [Paraglaciecola aquimarina]MDU0356355.1 polysaccharide deacetylase family protein [Paraglaciecola aquimarina]
MAIREYPLAILYFHRVLPQKDPFLPDDPTAEEFEDLIKTISQYYSTYTISKALELQSLGNLPKLSVCISFDDGYADNYTHALPILQKYGVPWHFLCDLQRHSRWLSLERHPVKPYKKYGCH